MYFEILIAAAAIVYFVLALRRMDLALKLFPLAIPCYLIKTVFAGIPFTLVELLIYALFVASALLFIKDNFAPATMLQAVFGNIKKALMPRESFFRRYVLLLVPLAVFIAGFFVALLAVKGRTVFPDGHVFEGTRVALGIIKGWIIVPVLLLTVYLYRIKSPKDYLDVLDMYGLSAVILSLWALFQAVGGLYITPDARASGPFESANYLSLYIVPALVYAVMRLWDMASRDRGNRKISFYAFGLLIVFAALLVSKSYTGMVAAFLGALFYFGAVYWQRGGFNRDLKKIFKYVAGFMLLLLMTALLVYALDPGKWQAMFRFSERNSSSVRLEVYTVAAGLIGENWLTGIGAGQYEAMYKLHAERILGHLPYELNMLHPHNLFLAVWLNAGLLGLAAFVFILAAAFKVTFRNFKASVSWTMSSSSGLKLAAAAMLFAILVYGLFDTPFFKNDLAIVFWIIMAAIFTRENEKHTG